MRNFSLNHYRGLIIPFFLAACLIAGYWFYWNKAASQIETQVRAAIPTSSAGSIKVTGFPYRLTLEIYNLNLKLQNGVAVKASSIVATATPFNPLLWVLEGAHDPMMALPNGPMRPLKATNLKSSLRLHREGLERFSLTFDGLATQGDGGWSVGKGLFHLMTQFDDSNTLGMVADFTDVQIGKSIDGPAAILGDKIHHIYAAGPVTQRRAFTKSITDWRQAGGKFTIMAGEIIWGPVYLTKATGDLFLSAQNKWQGKIAGEGALRPEGITVSGLSGPIDLEIRDSQLFVSGLPGIDLSGALRQQP